MCFQVTNYSSKPVTVTLTLQLVQTNLYMLNLYQQKLHFITASLCVQ